MIEALSLDDNPREDDSRAYFELIMGDEGNLVDRVSYTPGLKLGEAIIGSLKENYGEETVKIVTLLWGLDGNYPVSAKEVANELGVTDKYVSQVKIRVIKYLFRSGRVIQLGDGTVIDLPKLFSEGGLSAGANSSKAINTARAVSRSHRTPAEQRRLLRLKNKNK